MLTLTDRVSMILVHTARRSLTDTALRDRVRVRERDTERETEREREAPSTDVGV